MSDSPAGQGSLIPGVILSSTLALILAPGCNRAHVESSAPAADDKTTDLSIPRKEKGPAKPRPAQTPLAVLSAIAADLEKTEAAERPQRRYLSLTHLHNNPDVSESALEAANRALRELAGFFSPPGEVLLFRPIDTEKTVFAVDLRELPWAPEETWRVVLEHYPYGLTYDQSEDAKLREVAAQVRKLSGTAVACVRGDWFAVALTRPPVGGEKGALKTGTWPLPPAVRELAAGYDQQELDLAEAAAELSLAEPGPLATLIREEPRFRGTLGLEPLIREHSIQRNTWEARHDGLSAFQEVSRQLKLGTP